MKNTRLQLGYIFNLMFGFMCSPILVIAITDIMGTAKGNAYTIQEPELSAYIFWGIWILLILLLVFAVTETLIKVFLFRDNLKQFFTSFIFFLLSVLISGSLVWLK